MPESSLLSEDTDTVIVGAGAAGLAAASELAAKGQHVLILEARERIFAQELLFEPGTDEAYSNSGYTLLADVIETVSGVAFTDYVRSALFEPAAMNASGFYSEPVWQTVDTAIGYDASAFGETTNRIIEKYGVPVPEVFPAGRVPIQTPVPLATPAPSPSPTPVSSPGASAAPAASATPAP